MNTLNDVITYVRRIVKTPSNASLSDDLIIDYINRFYIMDMDARIQLFDLKSNYQFVSTPGVTDYNMPLYSVHPHAGQTQPGPQVISYYPVYQGFEAPCYVNGIQVPFYTQRTVFYNTWPWYLQTLAPAAQGNGTSTTFTVTLPFFPAIPGHVDISGIIASKSVIDPIVGTTFNTSVPFTSITPGVFITALDSSNNLMKVYDSGQFTSANQQVGYLFYVNASNVLVDAGTVNYSTGSVTVTFPNAPAASANIDTQCYFFQQGIPRSILFYNNVIKILPPPSIPYVVDLTGYLSPAAFLATSASITYAYMSEYIARGAARKILSDTGDIEQLQLYEPFFREQEMLVWKRSQRQFTASRTATIFSSPQGQTPGNSTGTT